MTDKVHQPHDKFFKAAMSDKRVVREFLEKYLPEKLLAITDLNTLELANTEFISRTLEKRMSDTVYRVSLKGSDYYYYVICEHLTKADEWVICRWLEYQFLTLQYCRKNRKEGPLPFVMTVIVYTGRQSFEPRSFSELFGPLSDFVDKFWQGVYVNVLDERMDSSFYPYVSLIERVYQISGSREPKKELALFIMKLNYLESEGDLVLLICNYFIAANIVSEEELYDMIQPLRKDKEGIIMTIQELFEKKGEERGLIRGLEHGMQKGMQQGMQQGQQQILLFLLEEKFKTIPENYVTLVRNADSMRLNIWATHFLNAQSLEELFETSEEVA